MHAILENAPTVIYLKDRLGRYLLINRQFETLFHLTKEQILGKTDYELFPKEIADALRANDRQILQVGTALEFEEFVPQDDGIHTYLSIKFCLTDSAGVAYGVCGISTDITAVRESEERFRRAFEDASIGMALVGTDGRFLRVNHALCEIFGYTKQELEATTFQAIAHPEDLDIHLEMRQRLYGGDVDHLHLEKRCVHKNGQLIWVHLTSSLLRDSHGLPLYQVSQMHDITERKKIEEQIRATLTEKEVLLKEIHHRLKNNLQIISGLLYLQSRYVEDKKTLQVLQENRDRIQSMALIHEKLYGSQNLNQIDFMDYISSPINNLIVSGGVNQDFIALKLNIEPVCLDIDTAIPCGLIVNELVSNALKHAFPQARRGEIAVDFYASEENSFELIVRDNGVGFTGELNFQNLKSLGLRLVHSLATKQLDGTIEADGSQGAKFKISFEILNAISCSVASEGNC